MFVHNVDPFSKVLHIPTSQLDVFTAIAKPEEVAADMSCLLFSIFFSAIVSLGPDEVKSRIGMEKADALKRFKLGLEISLAQANILESPKFKGIQALSIYLVSL